jgi:hypothetical protein
LIVTAPNWATIQLSGAVAGHLTRYRLRLAITGAGESEIDFPGGVWPLGAVAPSWDAGSWEIELETIDGGTTIDLERVRRTLAGFGDAIIAEFNAPSLTALEDYTPDIGPPLLPTALGSGYLGRDVPPLQIVGGALYQMAGGFAAHPTVGGRAWLANFGLADVQFECSMPQGGGSNYVGVALRVSGSRADFVAVDRTSSAIISISTYLSGVRASLASITLSSEWTGVAIPLLITATGRELSSLRPRDQPRLRPRLALAIPNTEYFSGVRTSEP